VSVRRTAGPSKRKAEKLVSFAAEKDPQSATVAVGSAVVFALLEVAWQIGRVADNVPLWGPPEER
jgi:hypothetical protein